ncbi:MAG: NUDIX hydrolase [Alphaproteobacteria bacterium]|nr:MAG: NUDIX hydrolase [Alphaproteobacteria bacterium]
MGWRAADGGVNPAPPIRDAATVVIVRDAATDPRVLVGQRGKGAAFMPSKFVFPGGAVDAADAAIRLAEPPSAATLAALGQEAAIDPTAVLAAAVREVWEETGLAFARPDPSARADAASAASASWARFLGAGLRPSAAGFTFFFRAITPPGRPRRFDARFFLVDADRALGDLDDFSGAEDELANLHWVRLDEMRRLDVPFITEVALAEVAARLGGAAPSGVPFFDNSGTPPRFLRLAVSGDEDERGDRDGQ